MNRDEDKILHGLYYERRMVDEEIIVRGNELSWLTVHSFADGAKKWRDEQKKFRFLKRTDELLQLRAITTDEIRPVNHLAASGLVTTGPPPGVLDPYLRIKVTLAGAERARRLHSWPGRLGLWYSEYKDRFTGLLITTLLTIVVTLVTYAITHKFDRSDDAPSPCRTCVL